MKTFTETQVAEMLSKAFDSGESWGATYSGWFQPTANDTASKKAIAINQILNNNEDQQGPEKGQTKM